MCELYSLFSQDWKEVLDYSDQCKVELFNYESYGIPITNQKNGYLVGKKWLNVQVAMWKEDISKGLFCRHELYSDPKYPHWWLDNIFKTI